VTDAPLAEVDGEIVPQGAVAQETDQLMPRLAGSLSPADTVLVVPASTVLLPSKYENATAAGTAETVMMPDICTDGALTALAVTVTSRSAAGILGGAV
jgi:hypothetical protein